MNITNIRNKLELSIIKPKVNDQNWRWEVYWTQCHIRFLITCTICTMEGVCPINIKAHRPDRTKNHDFEIPNVIGLRKNTTGQTWRQDGWCLPSKWWWNLRWNLCDLNANLSDQNLRKIINSLSYRLRLQGIRHYKPSGQYHRLSELEEWYRIQWNRTDSFK